jgi:leader peptidase (prepilin peptidase)/N-methyltransferase
LSFETVIGIYVFLIGLALGSFLNVLIARLPRGISIASPPSSCPKCGSRIKPYDNIPVLSYLILRGRCRSCCVRIPLKYPVVELVTAVLIFCVYLKFGQTLLALKYGVFVFLLLGAGFTDLFTAFDEEFECGIIPDSYTIGGAAVGMVFSFFTVPGFQTSLLGAAAGFLALFIPGFVYKLLRKQEGMGGGDIKLMAMIGAFLGYVPIYFVVFGSALAGVIISLPYVFFLKNWKYMIPFGPFMVVSAIFFVFFQERILTMFF